MKKMMIALLTTAMSSAAWGQQPVKSEGELTSDKVEAVRQIGQAVLGAKHSYIPPAALNAAQAELEALRRAINKSQSVVSGVVSLQLAAPASQASAAKDQEIRNAEEKRDMNLRLQAMRARHTELDAEAANSADGEERALERGASDKLLELEQELADAQAAPDSERRVRLGALSEKLTPQSSAGKAAESEPTISTIVEHRR